MLHACWDMANCFSLILTAKSTRLVTIATAGQLLLCPSQNTYCQSKAVQCALFQLLGFIVPREEVVRDGKKLVRTFQRYWDDHVSTLVGCNFPKDGVVQLLDVRMLSCSSDPSFR